MTAEQLAALTAEVAALRAENHALRIAMNAIRTLTDMTAAGSPPVPVAQQRPVAPVTVDDHIDAAPVVQEKPLRLLNRMKTKTLHPRAPFRKARGSYLEPYWRPPLAGVDEIVQYAPFHWRREHDGPVVHLDRTAAHLSTSASVTVAHDELKEAPEPVQWDNKPGYYFARYCEWREEGTPHPLGPGAPIAERDGGVWIPHTRVKLLADLAVQGRWEELGPMSAWIGQHSARLQEWAADLAAIRTRIIEQHGRDSVAYEEFKEAFSMAHSLMIGDRTMGQSGRRWKCDIHRPDWTYAIRDLSAVTMWRWADDLKYVAIDAGRPDLAPVGIVNQDELIIPADALDLFTSAARRPTAEGRQGRAPLRIDPLGLALGTFKIKAAA